MLKQAIRSLREKIKPNWHRESVGGLWEEIGKLQTDFLISQGLQPRSFLLDIGCGSLRGGIHYIEYLEPGHYFGIDRDADLIAAGREIEIPRAALQQKNATLAVVDDFDFRGLSRKKFDFAIAQSVFTHLPLNSILRCLVNVETVLAPQGGFYATFFENTRGERHVAPLAHTSEDGAVITTFPDRDPFHYTLGTFERMCEPLNLSVEYVGEWGHPRGQKMLRFRLKNAARASAGATTGRPPEKRSWNPFRRMQPGDPHYRAYVGPPERYDLVSAMVFNLLTTLGLRENHRLLDIGCGSLRCGRLLIPYLNRGNYTGVEPNGWLIDEGIANEIGGDLIRIKQPHFFSNADFRYDASFGQFDYAVAQSIFSHASAAQIRTCLASMAERLEPAGALAATFMEGAEDYRGTEWLYPGCATYREQTMKDLAAEAGLIYRRLDWRHPNGQTWALFHRPGYRSAS